MPVEIRLPERGIVARHEVSTGRDTWSAPTWRATRSGCATSPISSAMSDSCVGIGVEPALPSPLSSDGGSAAAVSIPLRHSDLSNLDAVQRPVRRDNARSCHPPRRGLLGGE